MRLSIEKFLSDRVAIRMVGLDLGGFLFDECPYNKTKIQIIVYVVIKN